MADNVMKPGKYDVYVVKVGEDYFAIPPVAIITNRHVKMRNLTGEDLEVDFLRLGKPDSLKRAPARGGNDQDLKDDPVLFPAGIYDYSVKVSGTTKTARGNSEPKIIVDP
jgi:hypothetical protein